METWVDVEPGPWRLDLSGITLKPLAGVARVYRLGYMVHEVMVTEQDGQIQILGGLCSPGDRSFEWILEALGKHV